MGRASWAKEYPLTRSTSGGVVWRTTNLSTFQGLLVLDYDGLFWFVDMTPNAFHNRYIGTEHEDLIDVI